MFGRIVGEAGRGFGVDLDEHPSVNLAKVTTRRRSMVSNEGCAWGAPPLVAFGDAAVLARVDADDDGDTDEVEAGGGPEGCCCCCSCSSAFVRALRLLTAVVVVVVAVVVATLGHGEGTG